MMVVVVGLTLYHSEIKGKVEFTQQLWESDPDISKVQNNRRHLQFVLLYLSPAA